MLKCFQFRLEPLTVYKQSITIITETDKMVKIYIHPKSNLASFTRITFYVFKNTLLSVFNLI